MQKMVKIKNAVRSYTRILKFIFFEKVGGVLLWSRMRVILKPIRYLSSSNNCQSYMIRRLSTLPFCHLIIS